MRSQIEKSYGMPIILNKHIKDKEGKYLVFCKKKRHLQEIKETVIGWFRTAGCKNINVYEVYSDYENKDAEYKAFCDDTSHNLKLMFCVDMLNEGLHLENISGVLLLRPTRSSIVWHQQIGRAIEANNTNTPVIIDAVNNFSAVGQGMGLLREIKDVVAKEKESYPDFDDSGFEDIDTFFVLENVIQIQEMFREIEGRLVGREWTEEEDNILREYYPAEGSKVVDRLEGRTKGAAMTQANKLGLKIFDRWSDEENEILRKYYPIEGYKVKNRLDNKTRGAIKVKVKKLGLKAPDNVWTEEENNILKKWYPIEGIKVKDKLIGRTKNAVISQVCKLGIKVPDKLWTEEENEILRKYYPTEGYKVRERLKGRTKRGIQIQAHKIGVKSQGNNNKYKYVYRTKNKYTVAFRVDGKKKNFGTYEDEDEAGKVAMQKAKEYGKVI